MLLDNGIQIGHHMMNLEFGIWVYLIFGLGIILLIVVILGFILLYNNRKNRYKHKYFQNTVQKQKENEINDNTFQNVNFCYNCGKKLEDGFTKFCPFCGVKN